MSADAFRFVHAADWHLEQPVFGLAEVPGSLRDLLIDAPYLAAERVFDAALAEDVDFLVLAGDVVNPQTAGPRAVDFLLAQFARLAERNVSVYWACGRADRSERWPLAAALPENVHVFSRDEVEEVPHFRDEQPLLTVVGRSFHSRPGIDADDFRDVRGDRFTLAVAYGRGDAEAMAECNVQYWALGGRHRRRTLFSSPGVAHYPGSPQSRCAIETGSHGCTLVRVDESRKVHTQTIATDVLRWHAERITLDTDATRDDLENQLGDRMLNLLSEATGQAHLLSWKIVAGGELGFQLRRRGLGDELMRWLRAEFANSQPAAWTASLHVESPERLPKTWYDEDTILGDFLRGVRECQAEDGLPLDLAASLTEDQANELRETGIDLTTVEDQESTLREVAVLGADLLRGEDAAL